MQQLFMSANELMNRGHEMGLKEIRESQGLTQQQLAQKSGINRGSISRLEANIKPIENATFKTVVKLGDALQVSDLRDFLD